MDNHAELFEDEANGTYEPMMDDTRHDISLQRRLRKNFKNVYRGDKTRKDGKPFRGGQRDGNDSF